MQPEALTLAIAAILRSAFPDALMTQAQLGEVVGVPRSTIGHYMRGSRVLDVQTFAKVCRALYLDPANVLDVALTATAE